MAKKKAARRTRKASTAKKTRTPSARKDVNALSAAQAEKLFRIVNRAVREAGFDGTVTTLHLTPPKRRTVKRAARAGRAIRAAVPPAAAAFVPLQCPPPQRLRRVCERLPDGRVRCEDRCV